MTKTRKMRTAMTGRWRKKVTMGVILARITTTVTLVATTITISREVNGRTTRPSDRGEKGTFRGSTNSPTVTRASSAPVASSKTVLFFCHCHFFTQ